MTDRLVDPTRQGIDLPERRAPDDVDWTGRAKPVPLADAISMVDAWVPDFAPFTMHQMCRRLREEYEDLQRTFDLRRKADMRAIGRWQAAHPGKEYVWPDRADMVVWLLEAHDDEASAMEPDIIGRALETITAYDAAEQRMLAAIPCGPKRDGGGTCTLSGHPYAACCRLRVALRFGEPVETDHLPDSGEVHLFAPGRGKDQARVSAGCVKLIEPTIHERNETLDHDFDRSAG